MLRICIINQYTHVFLGGQHAPIFESAAADLFLINLFRYFEIPFINLNQEINILQVHRRCGLCKKCTTISGGQHAPIFESAAAEIFLTYFFRGIDHF
jgi:hypothetical protein